MTETPWEVLDRQTRERPDWFPARWFLVTVFLRDGESLSLVQGIPLEDTEDSS